MEPIEIVASHLRAAFVDAFGAVEFDVWLGKDGLRHHTAAELGAALGASLRPLLADPAVASAVAGLADAGTLAGPHEDPGPP